MWDEKNFRGDLLCYEEWAPSICPLSAFFPSLLRQVKNLNANRPQPSTLIQSDHVLQLMNSGLKYA